MYELNLFPPSKTGISCILCNIYPCWLLTASFKLSPRSRVVSLFFLSLSLRFELNVSLRLSFNIVRSGVTAITPKDIDSSKLIAHSKIACWYCHLFLMEVRQCVKCGLTKIWFYETLLTDNMLPNLFYFF